VVFEALRLVHQQRCVGLDAFFVATAEEATDGLASDFSENIPEGDVDSANGMGDGAATSEPEHILVEFLADAFGFDGVFALVERFEDGERGSDKRIIREHAAEAGDTFVRVDGDERVDAVFRAEFVRPSTFGGCAAKACATDFSDFHR
jgi:hypothetical protein